MLGAQRSTADGGVRPRILMLGLGWFPESLGGLDRYFRALLEAMPEARGVVIGPAGDAPAQVEAVSSPRGRTRPAPCGVLPRRPARGGRDGHHRRTLRPLRAGPDPLTGAARTPARVPLPWALGAGERRGRRRLARPAAPAPGARAQRPGPGRRGDRPLRRIPASAGRALSDQPLAHTGLAAGGRHRQVQPRRAGTGSAGTRDRALGLRRRLCPPAGCTNGHRGPP